MVRITSKGDFKKTQKFLKKATNPRYESILDIYGRGGVEALAEATPLDSGKTASSWYYEIQRNGDQVSIIWNNSNVNNGVNIAVILNSGHGTGWGGYVVGREYIKPAIRPIFDAIANGVWEEVTK